MTMPRVFQLGHIAVGAADVGQTRDYYVETLGLQEVGTGDGAAFLSVGHSPQDLVLRPADDNALLHLGYLLNAGTDLGDFAKDLSGEGLTPERKSDAMPGVADMVEVEVTGGHVLQFFNAPEGDAPGFSGRGISPLRLGHVAIVSPEAEKLVAFYRDFLGFHETDWIGELANFLTCNHDHHVVNIVNAPPTLVHHIAFQLADTAQHAVAADKLRAAGIQTKWGPSRHTAGHNLAAYHKDPNSLLIELYTDMDVYIPELGICEPRPWHEHLPMKPKRWGLDELSGWQVDFQYDLAQAP